MAAWQTGPVRSAVAPQPVVCFTPPPAGTSDAPERAPENAAPRARPFADLLRQSRIENATPVPPPSDPLPKPTVEEAGANGDASEATNEATTTPAAVAKTKARLATTPKVATQEHPAEDASERVRGEKASAPESHDGDSSTAGTRDDAWIAQTLAGESTARSAHERASDELRQSGTRSLASDEDGDAPGARAGGRGGRVEARATGRVDANEARAAARSERNGDESAAASATPMLAATLAEAARSGDVAATRPGTEARVDALAPTLAAGTASPAAELHGAAAPAEISLPTSVDSPDFGAAFGVQVSLLAQDGVQQAELHLNPAETGPVSIHIALDGSDARIDFGADLAATREAIERSLPELAAALRDAGLTLTGGGVSQHAGERPTPGDDGSRSAHAAAHPGAAVGEAAAVRVARRVAAGGVDLYA
jgi:flagellar hook-length control protein FliK